MPATVALGPATKKVAGPDKKRIDAPNTNSFPTKVAPENANGAPVVSGFGQIVIPAGDVLVTSFADYNEVRTLAGDRYEASVLAWANDAARSAQLSKVRAESKKLTAMPTNAIAFVQGIFSGFELSSLFAEKSKAAGKAKKTVAREAVADLATKAAEMSLDELRAALAALAGK